MSAPSIRIDTDVEHCYIQACTARIHYVLWRGRAGRPLILLLHGVESNSSWFMTLGARLAAKGYLVAAIDRPGCGLSSGRRGDLESLARLQVQLTAVIRDIDASLPVYCLGFSWGARWCLTQAIDCPEHFRGLMLLCPGLVLRKPYSLTARLSIAATGTLFPTLPRPTPVASSSDFTANPRRLEFIQSDPQRLSQVTSRFLWQSWRMARIIERQGKSLRVPLLHLLAANDRICDNGRNRELVRSRMPATPYSEIVYPDADHALPLDCDRFDIAADIDQWVRSVALTRSL